MSQKKTHARTTLSRAIIVALSASFSITAVQGQEDTSPEALEEIIVLGFARSLQNAIETKRNADSVIESLSAEDIGKLPDISIADALSRLPGVSSQRTGGQSGAINIRGLDQGLILSTLNGREQTSTTGGRAIDFSQYPSELISGADIYKSSEAKLIEGGLGGTVELKLARPLSAKLEKTHNFTTNFRGSFNDRAGDSIDSSEYGYRSSVTYQGVLAEETVGLTVGYSRLVQPNSSFRFGTDTFTQTGRDFDGNGTNDFVPFRYGAEELGGEDQRDSFIASIQVQANEKLELAFDSYYSKFDSSGFARGVTVIGPQSVGGGTTLLNPVISNDVVVSGQFVRDAASPISDPNNPFTPSGCCGGFGITPSSDTQTRAFENELLTLGFTANWTSDAWTVNGDISYSKSDAFAEDARLVIHQVNNGFQLEEGVVFDFALDGLGVPQRFSLQNNFGDDPTQLRVGAFQAFPTTNEDDLFALASSVEYAFEDSFFSSIEIGARLSERTATQRREGFAVGNEAGFYQFARNNDDTANGAPFNASPIAGFSPVFVDPSLYSVEQFNSEFSGFPNYLNVNFDAARALFPNLSPNQVAGRSAAIAGGNIDFLITESFEVVEETAAAFAQMNIDGQLLGLPVRGNIGVRYVNTDQSSTSSTILNGEVLPISLSSDYDEFLPSFNMAMSLNDNTLLRVGIAKVIARPDLDDLSAGNSVNVNGNDGTISGTGNNTNLLPFEANQIDLSLEHYTESGGIFTAAAFYKDLNTFIISQTEEINFIDQGFVNPANVSLNPGVTLNPIGNFTSPTNGTGGRVAGVELAFTQTFDWLPAPFSGLGVTANYSYTDSSIDLPDTQSGRSNTTITLPGLSENVFNATVFYALGGFETRLGYRFRDKFISRQQGIGEQLPFTDDESVFDFQSSYRFADGSRYDGLTLLFQVNNLTDESVTTFFNSPEQLSSKALFGRQVFMGGSYSF